MAWYQVRRSRLVKLEQLARTWSDFGTEDPLWAILSNKSKRGNKWDIDEFLATGRVEISEVLKQARALRPQLPMHVALDFGCGVGRLSQALADDFDSVHGVDVAVSMLDRAGRLNRHGDRCQYHLNTVSDLSLFESSKFDFIYSNITLQHMPSTMAHGYIREFLRVLMPTGLLVFQLPGEPRKRVSPLARVRQSCMRAMYLGWHRWLHGRPIMDMYGTPVAEVHELIEAAGGKVLNVEETTAGGPDWTSFRYCVALQG